MSAAPVPVTAATDFNRDRRVDVRDLATVRSVYGATLPSPPPGDTVWIPALSDFGRSRSRPRPRAATLIGLQ
jgi:hypothetical protein